MDANNATDDEKDRLVSMKNKYGQKAYDHIIYGDDTPEDYLEIIRTAFNTVLLTRATLKSAIERHPERFTEYNPTTGAYNLLAAMSALRKAKRSSRTYERISSARQSSASARYAPRLTLSFSSPSSTSATSDTLTPHLNDMPAVGLAVDSKQKLR